MQDVTGLRLGQLFEDFQQAHFSQPRRIDWLVLIYQALQATRHLQGVGLLHVPAQQDKRALSQSVKLGMGLVADLKTGAGQIRQQARHVLAVGAGSGSKVMPH